MHKGELDIAVEHNDVGMHCAQPVKSTCTTSACSGHVRQSQLCIMHHNSTQLTTCCGEYIGLPIQLPVNNQLLVQLPINNLLPLNYPITSSETMIYLTRLSHWYNFYTLQHT